MSFFSILSLRKDTLSPQVPEIFFRFLRIPCAALSVLSTRGAVRRNIPLFRAALSFVKRLKRLYGRETIAAEPHDKPLRFQRRKRAVKLKKGDAGLCRDLRNVRLGERSESGKRRRFRIG